MKRKPTNTDLRIARAVVGFLIPMMSIPRLYRALENAINADALDVELRELVARFPGVEPSPI